MNVDADRHQVRLKNAEECRRMEKIVWLDSLELRSSDLSDEMSG